MELIGDRGDRGHSSHNTKFEWVHVISRPQPDTDRCIVAQTNVAPHLHSSATNLESHSSPNLNFTVATIPSIMFKLQNECACS